MKSQVIFIFYHYYYLIFSKETSSLEKKMLESFALEHNIDILLDNDVVYLYDDILFSFELKFEFLFYFFKNAVDNFSVDNQTKKILKNYTLMVGFCNSDVDQLNDYILESIMLGKTFKEVFHEVSV